MPRLANGCRSIDVPPFSALKAVSVDGGVVLHLTVVIYLEFMNKTGPGGGGEASLVDSQQEVSRSTELSR